MRIVIIADDLTGACDTAVKICQTGHSVPVYLNDGTYNLTGIGIAINTDTRSLSAHAAYQKVADLAGTLKDREGILVYKKIDSLFRGNVLAEIDALLDVFGYEAAIIVSSIPKNKRAVKNGYLIAPGSAWDGMNIVRTAFRHAAGRCRNITLDMIRQGKEALRAYMESAKAEGARYLIMDAETEADIRKIAEAAYCMREKTLMAGASGFIVPLFSQWEDAEEYGGEDACEKCKGTCILYVIGTNNPTTMRQVEYLSGQEGVVSVRVRACACMQGDEEEEIRRCIREAEEVMKQKPEALLLAIDTQEMFSETAMDGEKSALEHTKKIADCCAEIAKEIIGKRFFNSMVVSGGDTAQLVLEKLHIDSMRIVAEFAPGISVAVVENGCDKMTVVTKSGGFGDDQTLYSLKPYLRKVGKSIHVVAG